MNSPKRKKFQVQYLQIADDAKNSFNLVEGALHAASTAEQGNKQMTVSFCYNSLETTIQADIDTARNLLDEHSEGAEGPQKRANSLKERAAQLLYKAQKYNEEINGEFLIITGITIVYILLLLSLKCFFCEK